MIQQLDMLSRNTDPATSNMAARQLLESGALDTQRALVYAVLSENEGLTSRELADLVPGGDKHEERARFSRRLPDLKNLGLAAQGDARPCTSCKRTCVTWCVAGEE